MTASELVEQLQIIIKEKGDFNVEFVEEGYLMDSPRFWYYTLDKVKFNKFKKIIEVS